MLQTAETDTRTDISAGAVGLHDTKYLSVKHLSLHFYSGIRLSVYPV